MEDWVPQAIRELLPVIEHETLVWLRFGLLIYVIIGVIVGWIVQHVEGRKTYEAATEAAWGKGLIVGLLWPVYAAGYAVVGTVYVLSNMLW